MDLSDSTPRGPRPLANILDIAPYTPGEAMAGAYKLSANENPLGFAPAVSDALAGACRNLETYPEGSSAELRAAIASVHGLDPARIICGAGSDEIFQLLARAYLGPGDEIVQSAHAFLVYQLVAQQSGAVTRSVPERSLTADVDAMLDAVSDRTRIVFLANPNNPTGTYLPFDEVRRLHAGLREDILLVLDAAYAEYVSRNDYSSGLELAAQSDNVLMTRTFSKIHGLAALRLGWAFGPGSVIDALNRVRGPFNVSSLAQAAGIAAISEHEFVRASQLHNASELARLSDGLPGEGREITPSVGNFLLIRFAGGPDAARATDTFLRARGLYLRRLDAYGLPDCLRLSVGTREANTAVLEAFGERDAGATR